MPEPRGRIVVAFLEHYFARYVDTGFTAEMEEALDKVSAGDRAWRDVLTAFWAPFNAAVADAMQVRARAGGPYPGVC